jgi:general secretion pathway protein D
MRLSSFRSSLSLLALAATAPFSPAQTATTPAPQSRPTLTAVMEGPFPITLPEAPLDAVLQLLEMITGRTVLRPQNLPGATIHLETPPLPADQALLALETVLAMNGIGITPVGDRFIKVVQLGQVRVESPELIEGSTLEMAPSGRIVAKVFTLEFLRAQEFFPMIGNLLNPQLGGAVLFQNANAALVTDSVSTLQRIETLITQLDRPVTAGMTPKFYPLEHAKASDLVNKIRTILQGTLQQQMGTATTFNADDRTNQIVLIADPRLHSFFDDLIDKLDVRADPNTRNDVIYLKHANAPDVATLVSQLISGQTKATQQATGSVRPGQLVTNQNQPQPAPQTNVVQVAGAEFGAGTNEFSTFVTVLADERSNAVVVSGTVDDLRLIRELVEKIDVLLAQVRIEVVIVEVTLRDSSSTGIQSLGLQVENGKLTGFRGSGAGIAVGGAFDSDGNPTDFATRNGYDLTGLIQLSTTPRKNNANILSVPAIVTTHNKTGRIFVGQETPTISSYLPDTTTGGTTGSGYRTSVSREEIGITLEVKPLIGIDGSVQLEIKQTVEDIIDRTTIDGNEQPIIGKRETESFISVLNGEIIVLGGLQRDTNSHQSNRLGPIPIIGDLFGSRTRSKEKTDLIFFLRPIVLTNTPTDNAEALRRIQGAPQEKALQRALNPDAPREEELPTIDRAPRRGPRG